jgi:uncharacterized membrane protein YraQ (UPF0718 family)
VTLSRALLDFGTLLLELLALLLAVSMALALLVRRVGLGRVHRWLGGSRIAATLKGVTVGFLVPFCTYSAIPSFVGMVDARLRTATLAGFLLAAPLLDPLVLAVLWLLFGWQATLAYTTVTIVVVALLALVADMLAAERLLRPARRHAGVAVGSSTPGQDASCPVEDPFSDKQPWRGMRKEVPGAARYAAGLVRGLALPMTLAVAAAVAIIGLVPQELIVRLAGPDNSVAVPTAAVLGAPFYVSTESFLPVAAALHTSGMGLGAVFALVISAAGVNLPELALLGRLMRPSLLAAYVTAVVGMAIAAGYLIPAVL